MKTQLVLTLLALTLFMLFNQNGQSMALSFVTAPNMQRGWAANLYERSKIWFDKSLEDVEKTLSKGISDMKEQVKEWKKELEEADNKKASADDIEQLKKDQGEKFDKMQGQLDELQKLKDRAQADESKKNVSIRDQVKKSVTKEVAEKLKQKGQTTSFEIKAAVNMVASNTVTAGRIPLWERDPGVAKAPDRQPFITDLVTVGFLGETDTASWVERTDRQGSAAPTAEGNKYSQMSTAYQEFSKGAEYITVFAKLSRKNLADIDYLASEIQTELMDSMELTLDTQVFNGDGTSPNLKGILPYAVAFAKPTGLPTTQDASYFDVLMAAQTQVQNNLFAPNYIVLNPTDALAMNLKKNSQNNYVLPPFWNGAKGLGVANIITNVGVTQGSFLVGDFTKSIFKFREGLQIELYDQNEDDAVKGFKTMTGTMRGVHYIKGPHTKAFVKGTFTTAITALSA